MKIARAPLASAFLAFAVYVTFAALGSGCARFTKTKQCRALIAQINPALDDVLTLTDGGVAPAGGAGAGGANGNAGTARYVSAAARYERLAKDLGPMEFSSEQMAKYVAEYASVISSSAQTLRALAAALDANNASEAERVSHELERLNVREHSAVSRMDTWCASE